MPSTQGQHSTDASWARCPGPLRSSARLSLFLLLLLLLLLLLFFVWLCPRIYHCSSWKNNRYNHRTSNLFSSAAVRGELPALVLHVTLTIFHGFSRLCVDNFTLMEKWCKRDKGYRIFRETKHDGIYMVSFAYSFFQHGNIMSIYSKCFNKSGSLARWWFNGDL